jgi:UPF0755 protein
VSELGFRTTGRRVKQRRGRGCIAVFIALAVILGGAALAVVQGREWLEATFTTPDYSGSGSGNVQIEVHDGDFGADIAQTLEKEGVVKSAEAFEQAAKRDSRSSSIQPGFYELRHKMSGAEALRLLLDPSSRIEESVTVPEGLWVSQTIDTLATHTPLPKRDIEAFVERPEDLGLPSYAKNKPEGFLFPATYPINPGTTADELLRTMVERYDEEADELNLERRAEKLGRTPLEIVTVASIIEAEVRQPNDFGKVAQVIYNRLDDGWKLEMDSTVHYAAGSDTGKVSTSSEERASKSPYNTYRYEGLPPGPIGSPGGDALRAALDPTPGDWMYFVAVNPDTGETKFAVTSDEHEANRQEWLDWCAKNEGRC